MKKFTPKRATHRTVDNHVVSVMLQADLFAPFYTICKETNTSPSQMANQMIRFALENKQ